MKLGVRWFQIALEFVEIGAKSGAEKAALWLAKLNLDNEALKAVQVWLEAMAKSPAKFKRAVGSVDDLVETMKNGSPGDRVKAQKEIDRLSKKALKQNVSNMAKKHGFKKSVLEKGWDYFFRPTHKLLLPGTNTTRMVSKYIIDVLDIPGTVAGGILLSLFVGLEGKRFLDYLERNEVTMKGLDKIIPQNNIDKINKVKEKWEVGNKFKIEKGELVYIMAELQEVMPPDEYKKFFKMVTNDMDDVIRKYIKDHEKVKKYIQDIRKVRKSTLYGLYDNMCQWDQDLDPKKHGTTIAEPVVSGVRTADQSAQQQKEIEKKGVDIRIRNKDYKFIFKGKYVGIYNEVIRGDSTGSDGGDHISVGVWERIIDCETLSLIIKDFCWYNKSLRGEQEEFCNGILVVGLDLKGADKIHKKIINDKREKITDDIIKEYLPELLEY